MQQLALFPPKSDWRPPDLALLPRWSDAKRIGLDCETNDPCLKKLGPGDVRDGRVAGYAFAIPGAGSHYLPVEHLLGDNMDHDQVLEYLRDQAASYQGEVVGANLSYDLGYLAKMGVHFHPNARFRDVQIAESLIWEHHRSYRLDAVSRRWLGDDVGKDEELLKQALAEYGLKDKGDLWRLPARYAGRYAEVDAIRPLQILEQQERDIDRVGLRRIWDLETDLLPVLVRMRRRGIPVNMRRVAEIEVWARAQEQLALDTIYQESGVRLQIDDCWTADKCARVVRSLGIEPPLTTGTKKPRPSIDARFLASIAHPAAKALIRARKLNKLRTTYCASIWSHAVNGRLHPRITQMPAQDDDDDAPEGAAFGRCASRNPNIQAQPGEKDKELGSLWRSIYEPEEGCELGAFDYSQQEPRLTYHLAAMMKLPGSAEIVERYRQNPRTDSHSMIAELAGIDRKPAKIVFLAKVYGAGDGKTAIQLGLPTETKINTRTGRSYLTAGPEAAAIIAQMHERLPFLRALSKAAMDKAESTGVIVTILGRHCHFERGQDGRYWGTYKALNRAVQGGAGDQNKKALIDLDRMGILLHFPVHDENVMSIRNRAEGAQARECMENAVKLLLPVVVDEEYGPNWGNLTKVNNV